MDLMDLALNLVVVDINSDIDFAPTLRRQMEGEIVKARAGLD